MLLADGFTSARRKPWQEGLADEADGADNGSQNASSMPAQPLKVANENGPVAEVPRPAVGAPGTQPVLQAPQPAAGAQSVAQMALGTGAAPAVPASKPGQQAAPSMGDGNVYLQGLGNVSGESAQNASAAPKPAVGAPAGIPQYAAPVVGETSLPEQTTTFGYSGSAADLFPGADGKGDVSGGSTGGAFWQAFDQSKSAPLSPEEKATAMRIMQGDESLMNEYKAKYGANWLSKWGADQDMYAERLRNQTATAADIGKLSGLSGKDAWDVISGANNPSGANYFNALRAMTPDQRRSFLSQWKEGSYDRALLEGSLAAQGITIDSGDTGRRWDGKTQNNGPMASAIPVYSNDVRGSGANSQGLAGYNVTPAVGAPPAGAPPAETAVPGGGVRTSRVPDAGASANGGGAGGGGASGNGATAGSGTGAPSTTPPANPPVNPPPASSGSGAGGVGGGTPAVGGGPAVGAPSTSGSDPTNLDPVLQAIRSQVLSNLANPSPYDDALFQREVSKAKLSNDEQWNAAGEDLKGDLANRGLDWSTIAAGKLSDFATSKGRAWDDVLTGLLSDRAKGIASARAQAMDAANAERGYYADQGQRDFGNRLDVAKLAEYLRQGREGTALDWTRLGLNALGDATGGAQSQAGAYANSAAANAGGVGDWIQEWLRQYYGNAAKPKVGAPVATTSPAGVYG